MNPIMDSMLEMQYQIDLLRERDREHELCIKNLTQRVKQNEEESCQTFYQNNAGVVKEDVKTHSRFLLWAVLQIKALKLQMNGPYTAHLTDAERGDIDPKDPHVFDKEPIDAIRSLIQSCRR
jgi:hypothetical protein